MRIVIIGSGAMGCLFAARLTPLADVVMIGHWPEQLHALQQNGLRYIGVDGRAQVLRVSVTDDLANVPPADIAFVLVKSYQTAQAAQIAAQLLNEQGLAITLQNGLGNLEIIANAVGRQRAVLGTTTEGATLEKPGVVRHAGPGITHLAKPATATALLGTVAERLQMAGLEVHLTGNVEGILWGKLAVNAAINPLTALLGVRNGFLAENQIARELMVAAAEETARVAVAQGINLPFTDPGQQALDVAIATHENRSSMLQDVLNGRPTEIEAINGSIVQLGQRNNVATPINVAFLALVHAHSAGHDWLPFLQAVVPHDTPLFSQLSRLHDEVIHEHLPAD